MGSSLRCTGLHAATPSLCGLCSPFLQAAQLLLNFQSGELASLS
uniref:Sig3 n=1 Tax=Arundo donax TaxID=35708 RepID=A0A0A9EVT9_ARUDO